MDSVDQVSIPYRLATNANEPIWSTVIGESFNPLQVGYKPAGMFTFCEEGSAFQSLIGWLQTLNVASINWNTHISFNPLQVGYKPLQMQLFQVFVNQFQSLIGWLQTLLRIFLCLSHIGFQSLIGWLQTYCQRVLLLACFFVSIPYRLATNVLPACPAACVLLCFNPLQVGYKHVISFVKVYMYKCVSIPYRLATNTQQNLGLQANL